MKPPVDEATVYIERDAWVAARNRENFNGWLWRWHRREGKLCLRALDFPDLRDATQRQRGFVIQTTAEAIRDGFYRPYTTPAPVDSKARLSPVILSTHV